MLQLSTHDYTIDGMLTRDYVIFDTNMVGRTPQRMGYIRNKHISSAMLPLAFNEIGICQKTYLINENYDDVTIDSCIEDIKNTYENMSQTRLGFIRIYTDDVQAFYDKLDPDLFCNPSNAVQELYNKCMDQVRLREGVIYEPITKVKLVRGKHMVILISNYTDNEQASDIFLTIGLTPILFPDWADKFDETEINYFKVLVNRSQVKRISNVKATEAFEQIATNQKYKTLIQEVKLRSTVDSIVNNKIASARNVVRNAEETARHLLDQYADVKEKYFEANDLLNNLEKNREQTTEEIQAALKTEGIINVDTYGSESINVTFRTPLSFYNEDEAELVINNIRIPWIKQMLTEIFIEHKYKLNVISTFQFSYSTSRGLHEPGEVNSETANKYNALYNPHTHFFRCLGDYKTQLIDAQAKQDLLMFINIALASTRSINFRDGAVINRWVETLESYRLNPNYYNQMFTLSKCLENSEGELHSMSELYFNIVEEELEVQDL